MEGALIVPVADFRILIWDFRLKEKAESRKGIRRVGNVNPAPNGLLIGQHGRFAVNIRISVDIHGVAGKGAGDVRRFGS